MSENIIMKLGDVLIVPIPPDLHDKSVIKLQEELLHEVEETGALGVLLDISGVEILDSFLGRVIGDTAKMIRLLGAEAVLIGMKKEVVLTLLELGFVLKDIHTALNLEEGLALLDELKKSRE